MFRKGIWSDLVIVGGIIIGSLMLLYLPFVTRTLHNLGFSGDEKGMNYVYQNFDGLLYIVPAKTWYVPERIAALRLESTLPAIYYAAHLPLYPALIALFSGVFGSIKSMLIVSWLGSFAMAAVFYMCAKRLEITTKPLVLTLIFLFIPRLLILRAIGAPETVFIFCILASVFLFETKQFMLSGIAGACAALAKAPGILLLPAFALVCIEVYFRHKKLDLRWAWMFLIPLGSLAVGLLYALQYGDFFAYFHTGGVVPMPYPYSVFHADAKWVGTIWLEDILLYFGIFGITVVYAYYQKIRSFFFVPLVFLIASICVQHRDLSRYMAPLWPFVLLTFPAFFSSRRFLIVFILLLPAIYLYAINFMIGNILPVSDWRPYL